jgi:nucleotide-binding universal stress UspA family protein
LPKEDLESEEQKIKTVFDEAISRLVNCGFPPDNITTNVIAGVSSRSRAIAQAARQEGYSPVVVGRRGLSRFQEFFMGSVSNKLIQLSREKAVWVVT